MAYKAMLIDSSERHLATIKAKVAHEFEIDEIDLADSPLKALEAYVEEDFQFCFVSETIPTESLRVFMDDLERVSKRHKCIFVRIKEGHNSKIPISRAQREPYDVVVSTRMNTEDLELIRKAFMSRFKAHEVARRAVEVDIALSHLLAEIDRVAEDKRRGGKAFFPKIYSSFIADQTQFDEEVLTKYFESLTEQLKALSPQEITQLEIPEEFLRKAPPSLLKDSYIGRSRRVWSFLKKKFGKTSE